ncbi:hypothetical protein AHAS_Ahas05G0294000 [Arachis hypogaea]
MFHYDLLDETQNKLDYILPLSLTVENFLECRLHILVFKSGMAKFIHQCILDKRVQGSKTSNDSAQSSSAMLAVEKDDRHAIADKRLFNRYTTDNAICFTQSNIESVVWSHPTIHGTERSYKILKGYPVQNFNMFDKGSERKSCCPEFLDLLLYKLYACHKKKDNDPRLSASPLKFPGKLAIDILNNRLFISDSNHNRIVVTDLDGNFIVQIGSSWEQGLQDGPFDDATFNKLVTETEDSIKLLSSKNIVSLDVHNKLMSWIKDVESNVPAIDVLRGDSHKQIGEISEPEKDENTNNPDFKPEGVGVFEVISIELVTILQVRCRDEAGS